MKSVNFGEVYIGERQSGKTTWLARKLLKDEWISCIVPNLGVKNSLIRILKSLSENSLDPLSEEDFDHRVNGIITYQEFTHLITNQKDIFLKAKREGYKSYMDELNLYIKTYHLDISMLEGYTMTYMEK